MSRVRACPWKPALPSFYVHHETHTKIHHQRRREDINRAELLILPPTLRGSFHTLLGIHRAHLATTDPSPKMPKATQEASGQTPAPATRTCQTGVAVASAPAQLSPTHPLALGISSGSPSVLHLATEAWSWAPLSSFLPPLNPHLPTGQGPSGSTSPTAPSHCPPGPAPTFLTWPIQQPSPKHQPRQPHDIQHRANDTRVGCTDAVPMAGSDPPGGLGHSRPHLSALRVEGTGPWHT